jgi:hypothetical protein
MFERTPAWDREEKVKAVSTAGFSRCIFLSFFLSNHVALKKKNMKGTHYRPELRF